MLNQTVAGARQAFDALSGEIYGSVQTLLLNDSVLLRDALLGRLRQAGYASATGELGALSFGGPESVGSEETALAYAGLPVKAAPPAERRDLTFWTQGVG